MPGPPIASGAGFDPGIQPSNVQFKDWIAGSSPAMTGDTSIPAESIPL